MPRIKEIIASDLSRLLEDDNRFEIIDIRTPAEIERGVIPRCKNTTNAPHSSQIWGFLPYQISR